MSGYARDEEILEAIGINENEEKIVPVVPCVIIYPEHVKLETDDSMDNEEKKEIEEYNKNHLEFNPDGTPIMVLVKNNNIPGFKEFYKLCVKLPVRVRPAEISANNLRQ